MSQLSESELNEIREQGDDRPSMNITVKSIDVYAIHDRLRKDKTKEGKEVWNYIKKLNEALKMQQELTGKAISKLKSESTPPANPSGVRSKEDDAVEFAEWKDKYFHQTYPVKDKIYCLREYDSVYKIKGVNYGQHYSIPELYQLFKAQPGK